MKIVLSTNDLRLRVSPRHSWQGVSLNFSHLSTAQEAPSEAAAFIVPDGSTDNNPRIKSE